MSLFKVFTRATKPAATAATPAPQQPQPQFQLDNSTQQLFQAAQQGDATAVAKLLDGGVSPDARNEAGETALMLPAHQNNTDVVKTLLAHKANPNGVSRNGLTPLSFAAQAGNWEMVRLLGENGAKVSRANVNEHLQMGALLLRGMVENNAEQISALKSVGACDEGKLRDAVFQAVEQNDARRLEHYLSIGVPAELSDAWKSTLLIKAAQASADKVIAVLGQYGADVNAVNRAGETAQSIADHNGDVGSIHALALLSGQNVSLDDVVKSRAGAKGAPQDLNKMLYEAVDKQRFEAAGQLIRAGADAEPPQGKEDKTFDLAIGLIKLHDLEALTKFMESGAFKPELRTRSFTIMHVAAEQDIAIAQYIARKDPVLVNYKGKWGSTPLRVALENNNLPMAEALLAAGADPRLQGRTPHSAEMSDVRFAEEHCPAPIAKAVELAQQKFELIDQAAQGDAEALKQALALGVPADMTDGKGVTLLFNAAQRGHTEVVKTLLQNGAVATRDFGELGTPMGIAVTTNRPDIMRLLADAGANISAPDSRGWSPLGYIEATNSAEMKDAFKYCHDIEIVRMAVDATRLEKKTSVFKALKFKAPAAAAGA